MSPGLVGVQSGDKGGVNRTDEIYISKTKQHPGSRSCGSPRAR